MVKNGNHATGPLLKTLWEGETCFSLEPQEEWRFRAADTGCSQEAGAWEVMTALHMQKKQKQLPPFEKPQNESSFHFTFATALTCRKPTPVFLPLKPHGQRSLVGYSPWGCKESHTTEHTHTQHAEIMSWILIWFFFFQKHFLVCPPSSTNHQRPPSASSGLGAASPVYTAFRQRKQLLAQICPPTAALSAVFPGALHLPLVRSAAGRARCSLLFLFQLGAVWIPGFTATGQFHPERHNPC